MIKKIKDKIKLVFVQLYTRLHIFRFRQHQKNITNRIIHHMGSFERKNPEKRIRYWKQLARWIDPNWYWIYSGISGREDYRYIPADIYFMYVEPILNQKSMILTYHDKNMYERFDGTGLFPITFLRNINGTFYDREYNPMSPPDPGQQLSDFLDDADKMVIKPSLATGQGRNLRVFNRSADDLTINYLNVHYGKNYVVQEYIESIDLLKSLNPQSLNCFRVNTYRSVTTNEVNTDHIILKIGGKNSYVDNTGSGGSFINVNSEDRFGQFAIDELGRKLFILDEMEVPFSDFGKTPLVNKIREVAVDIAYMYPYHRILGIDMCIDSNEMIRVVDINNMSIGVLAQALSGPLFGDNTDEVIDYCKHRKPQFDPIGVIERP
ncbi:MAG: sugar-transfer associated ATP-grasp domain-containing protein [Candidatus Neomarinimicrobiota bacterium]